MAPFKTIKEKVGGRKVTGVLHIGAHHGTEYRYYKEMGVENLLMFEPLPDAFSILKRVVPEQCAVNKALGAENRKVEMFVEHANEGQSSSILRPKGHLLYYPAIQFTEKVTVDMVRLDDFLKNKEDFNLINIDVQGYELNVFKGATETLRHIEMINSEVNLSELYEGCPLLKDIDGFLETFNFKRVDLELDDCGQWGDAFYIKS